MISPLTHDDILWIARRIHEIRATLHTHPDWSVRTMDLIGVLLWSASVDGRDGERIIKDGWIPSGGRLKSIHFKRSPYTYKAFAACQSGLLTSIIREHIVPRNTIRTILLKTSKIDDSVRIIKEYSIVALLEKSEEKRLKPSNNMPKGWDAGIDWSQSPLPPMLPSPWARYSNALPQVVPTYSDGRRAF